MKDMKYNPGFLTDDELVSSFRVRESELESILETLRGCTAESNAHMIVLGSRGSGKTTLLLRAAAEARRDPALSENLFPVVFPEESYEIGSCGEFWLACLAHLADQAPRREDEPDLQRSYEELRAERDDRRLADRCLGAVLGFAEREDKRLVLVVENLNMMFADMRDAADDAWRLRHTLQTEPRIVLLASATSRFQQIDDPAEAFYGFFRPILLRPLDTGECAALWEAVSGRRPAGRSVRPVQILTGGNARLIAIVARFDSRFAFSALMDGLLNLIDDHTDYFKGHLDGLPAQERRVYLALAELWKPATTREIADRARLNSSACSAQLRRLCQRGAVEEDGGDRRRKRYYVTERLYNIYYLLRKRHGGAGHVVEVLIRFMSSYYSPTQLMDIGARIARDAAAVGEEMRALHAAALKRLIAEPRLAGYRDRLLTETPAAFFAPPVVSDSNGFGEDGQKSPDLLEKVNRLTDSGQILNALRAYNSLVREFDSGRDADALHRIDSSFTRNIIELIVDKEYGEVVNIISDIMQNFETHIYLDFDHIVFMTIMSSGSAEISKNQPENAVEIFDTAARRFGNIDHPLAEFVIAHALLNKGHASAYMNRPCDALKTYDEIMGKFGDSDNSRVVPLIADTLVDKSSELKNVDRIDESLSAADEALRRFHDTEGSQFDLPVARAFIIKSGALIIKGMREESRAALEDAVRIFCREKGEIEGTIIIGHLVSEGMDLTHRGMIDESLVILRTIERIEREYGSEIGGENAAVALANIGSNFVGAGRYEESLGILDDAIRRFEKAGADHRFFFVQAFLSKGQSLDAMGRKEEALLVYSEAMNKFDSDDKEGVRFLVGITHVRKCSTLIEMERMDEALDVLDKITDRVDAFDRAWLHVRPDSGNGFSERVGRLMLKVALHWLTNGKFADARATASRAFDMGFADSADRIDGHGIRAVASSLMGDRAASESDIAEALRMLPEAEDRVKVVVAYLVGLCGRFHESDVLKWVSASPSSMLLLPMTVALRRELGESPEVAREVSEVADDIRNDLAKMKAHSPQTRFGERLDEVDVDG